MSWTPWHQVVRLREELRQGDLSLALFAADLYEVVMGRARRVYGDPREFFALTYPTHNLRELARQVALRLAGRSDKAVRQLELTYGGGKTHALITLFHLVNAPDALPDLPAVREFVNHIGFLPRRARVAAVCFDKLDVEKGMEVRDPKGHIRRLLHPWSVLAYAIAGDDGLCLLHAGDQAEERESAPAETLLRELLALPEREGLATLVLLDEVLMYAREKVALDPTWRGRLTTFFQCLTQAATKVDRCAVVASLLATDPRKSDALGREITQELYTVFRREGEEAVEPVVKEDVAEILRRRFFTPESVEAERLRAPGLAAFQGVREMDEQTRREGQAAEERFLRSYPFHPDLTEVLYTKWTQLEGFQRARGVLRTFALALRDAEKWDTSPVIGPAVFLPPPGSAAVSDALRELVTVAATEEYEGRRHAWAAILQDELEKAQEIQRDHPALRDRELEQAVLAVFLHSQPIGQRAFTRDLFVLLGPTRPDRIELEKALRRWAEESYWLDEAALQDSPAVPGEAPPLPRWWRLGSRPNLTQMHREACRRVAARPEWIEGRLEEEIRRAKKLTEGASAAGVRVHLLPANPEAVEDDGRFHYAVLGPAAASEPGHLSDVAPRFLTQTTGPDRPRVYKNAIVLAVPSTEGLELARTRVKEYLAWEEVRSDLQAQAHRTATTPEAATARSAREPDPVSGAARGSRDEAPAGVDPVRWARLLAHLEAARKRIPEAIHHAYCIAVTYSEDGDIVAFRIAPGEEPLFQRLKADPRARIQETAVTAEALLPGGPYDLWREGEDSRWVKDLVGAFAQMPHLPKMLNPQAVYDTVAAGCRQGVFVLRLQRPDRSVRTFWLQEPEEAVLRDPALEAVLPAKAVLAEIPPDLLRPGALPGLWAKEAVRFRELLDYFSGSHVAQLDRGGYQEPLAIPRAERATVEAAVVAAVRRGILWLRSGPASLLAEEVPPGVLTEEAVLRPPPAAILPLDLLPDRLPEAWREGTTTALSLATALSQRAGEPLPWTTVRAAVEAALRARLLELAPASGPWPCDWPGAGAVRLQVPKEAVEPGPGPLPPPPGPGRGPARRPGVVVAEAELRPDQIQDLAEKVGEIVGLAARERLDVRFRISVEVSAIAPPGDQALPPAPPSDEALDRLNRLLGEVSDNLTLG